MTMISDRLTDEQLAEILSGVIEGVEPTTQEVAMAAELQERRKVDGSQLVGWTDAEELRSVEKDGCGYLFTVNSITPNADPRRVIKLYSTPPAPVIPSGLHPDTKMLVTDFCTDLAEKLYKAQLKYGYDADWKQDNWSTQCLAHFHQHIAKGDPRDVAAYCAFMWYLGWKTGPMLQADNHPVTPDGWVMIPAKATIAMIRAGGKAAREYQEEYGGNSPQVIYQAMLAAAPQPEGQ